MYNTSPQSFCPCVLSMGQNGKKSQTGDAKLLVPGEKGEVSSTDTWVPSALTDADLGMNGE